MACIAAGSPALGSGIGSAPPLAASALRAPPVIVVRVPEKRLCEEAAPIDPAPTDLALISAEPECVTQTVEDFAALGFAGTAVAPIRDAPAARMRLAQLAGPASAENLAQDPGELLGNPPADARVGFPARAAALNYSRCGAGPEMHSGAVPPPELSDLLPVCGALLGLVLARSKVV